MKKIMLLALLLITACLPHTTKIEDDYRSGTQGLEISFADSPQKVYAGSYMNLMVELRNRGATDLKSGVVHLSGYDPSALHFQDSQLVLPEILGKSAYMSDGGYEILPFPESSYAEVPFGETYTPTLMLSSCYQYQTIATPSVCVISHPSDIVSTDVCKPGTITLSSQGAPVAVTKVEQEVMEQMMNFVITVENVGTGKVVNLDSLFSACPFELKHTDLNNVKITVKLSGGGEPVCTPGNNIRLVDGKGVVFCKIPLEMETSYTTPLIIQLDYGYSQSVTRTFEIVRPPGSAKDDLGTPITDPSGSSGSTSGSTSGGTGTTSTTTSGTNINDQTGNCPCDASEYTPCVCLRVDGQRYECPGPIYVQSGSHTFSVYSSSSTMPYCSAGSMRAQCPASTTRDIQSDTTISIYGYETMSSSAKASMNCNIVVRDDY